MWGAHPVPCEVSHTLEYLLLETAATWEKEGIAHGEIRPVIGAVDDLLQHMILVFMDLATGYLRRRGRNGSRLTLVRFASDRLTTFGTQVLYQELTAPRR